MFELEYALSIYIDQIDEGQNFDFEYFKKNLSMQDFDEFLETIRVIGIYKSIKLTNEFEQIFQKLDEYKDELYSKPLAANFKKEKSANAEKAQEELDRIFNEEFGDDK